MIRSSVRFSSMVIALVLTPWLSAQRGSAAPPGPYTEGPTQSFSRNSEGQFTPALVEQWMTVSGEQLPGDDAASPAPAPVPLGVFACAPTAPASMDIKKCCLGTKAAPINADSLGNYFCYCVPQRMASVCGTVGSQGGGASIKENAERCVFKSTHPYWPGQSRSCVN